MKQKHSRAEHPNAPQGKGLDIPTASYLIGMDGGSKDGDLPCISIVCSESGQVIYSDTLAPYPDAMVNIPQSCPHCCMTGGCNDEK